MSKILNALEAQGLLTRRTAPTNRRSAPVSVTPAGQHELGRATARLGNLARARDPLCDPNWGIYRRPRPPGDPGHAHRSGTTGPPVYG